MFKKGEKVIAIRDEFEVVETNADFTLCLWKNEHITIPTPILDRLPKSGTRVLDGKNPDQVDFDELFPSQDD
jgi:hypothetical protein